MVRRVSRTAAAGRSLSALYAALQSTPELEAIYSAEATLQAMLDVEAALSQAQARCRLIPARAARGIARACDSALFDVDAIAVAARPAGNLAIPLVAALTARVAKADPAAARFVHWGATSQDIIDTAAMLQLRRALATIDLDLAALRRELRRMAQRHRRTVMTGRTLLQPAAPVSFGLKAAIWLDACERHRERLTQTQARCLVLQFGGAVGNLASLGTDGMAVARELGRLLKLPVPPAPWHATRDRIAEIAAVLGLLVGSLGKMARDLSLLMQAEIDEAREPAGAGRGGSSAMPHKRNPVAAAAILATAARAPNLVATVFAAQAQEHERALGGWQAEWSMLPELVRLTAGALRQMVETVGGLEVDAARMKANLMARNGLIMAEAASMALAAHVGRKQAHELVESASHRAIAEGRHLRAVMEHEPSIARHLDREALDRAFDPRRLLGASDDFISAVLKPRRKRRR